VFTGIVETVGRVVAIEPQGEKTRLVLEAPAVTDALPIGASVAVNGACLTVVEVQGGCVAFEAVRETLERSSLGGLRVGSKVNLERAMRADARLDGHIVQGHVDGTGTVSETREEGESVVMRVAAPPEVLRYVVEKGSITVDGVSLTVVSVGDEGFSVSLIPTTLEATTLGRRAVGDRVNIEVDILAKYVERLLAGRLA
jgi:riboflavin synthase